MSRTDLIACHDCDLLQRETTLPPGGVALCRRCGAELYRSRNASVDRTLAWALAATVFIIVANTFPILGLKVNATIVQTTLAGAGVLLYRDGMWPVSVLVFATTMLMPALEILAMLYLLLPLKFNLVAPRRHLAYRILQLARPWSMTEVLIVGVLVALVKLVHIASVVPGIGLWALGAAMISLAAMAAAFDPRSAWRHGGDRGDRGDRSDTGERGVAAARISLTGQTPGTGPAASAPTAARAGLFTCHVCGLLSAATAHAHAGHCPRCGAPLHFRKPDSIARTWAFLIAAMVLYIPANLLPIMHTSSLFGAQQDTIMSGVVYLWVSGSWPLAIVVFIASVAVPMMKILALMFLVISTQMKSGAMSRSNTRIYRLLEFVGPWSMLDIYVIAILVALVQFSALATITAGPAAIAFGAVVVLTMLAARSFDPRLQWDQTEKHHA